MIAENLRRHVRHLAETIGPRNFQFYSQLRQCADYLEEQLRACGYSVERLPFEADGQLFENLHTTRDRGPFTVVGAHYDSIYNCPGANDNASAVAALLELARLLPDRDDLRFVLFANEEPPFYKTEGMGSVVYVQNLLRKREPIANMICLETVGYYSDAPGSQRSPLPGRFPSIGNFVAVAADVQSHRMASDLLKRWPQNSFPCVGVLATPDTERELMEAGMGMSDNASFWRAKIPAVMITDTVFYRYDHYHASTDTWDQLTYEPFARMVESLARALARPLTATL